MSALNFQLPLKFNDATVDTSLLAGVNYTHGLPQILNLVKTHIQKGHQGVSAPGTVIYPGTGRQCMYASYGKSWLPGVNLIAYDGQTTTTVVCMLRVISYDPLTGLLWFELQYMSAYADKLATQWTISAFATSLISPGNTIANGYTAGNDNSAARLGLQLNCPRDFSIMYDDFIGKPTAQTISYAAGTSSVATAGRLAGITAVSHPSLNSTNYPGHPGTTKLVGTIGAAPVISAVCFGPVGALDLTDFGGAGTAFETCFLVPSLSVAGLRYSISAGMISSNSAAGPNAYVTYCDNLNGGAFQIITGAQNAPTTTNMSIVPVAGNWHKIRIEVVGSNLFITVNNGTTSATATISAAAVTGLGTVRGTVGLQVIASLTGAGTITITCDYLYFRKQLPGRR